MKGNVGMVPSYGVHIDYELIYLYLKKRTSLEPKVI